MNNLLRTGKIPEYSVKHHNFLEIQKITTFSIQKVFMIPSRLFVFKNTKISFLMETAFLKHAKPNPDSHSTIRVRIRICMSVIKMKLPGTFQSTPQQK